MMVDGRKKREATKFRLLYPGFFAWPALQIQLVRFRVAVVFLLLFF